MIHIIIFKIKLLSFIYKKLLYINKSILEGKISIIMYCITYMITYHPYRSDKPGTKYYIITESNRKVYFGASGCSDFTVHKDEERKQRYISRHKNDGNWSKSGIDTANFWSRWLLRDKTTTKDYHMGTKSRFHI
jgi:hypothetical protein